MGDDWSPAKRILNKLKKIKESLGGLLLLLFSLFKKQLLTKYK